MSNGSEVGGIIGGVIGAYFGGVQGFQWGYAIGSGIGGYVDPQKNYGPRLSDAATQTSTVGGPIPFGYGIFTTAGNLIWVDELKEHRKEERAGKGSGNKNVTFTYTRSYAVGVCAGAIHQFIWIKRNGKLVYAAQPNNLGTAMGWTQQQIADLAAASQKFRQKCRMHYGTREQMPDATIVAVEGVGNVSAFRDLAYITVRDDDVTNTSGAIPMYEFCVNATLPNIYFTSPPYPIDSEDAVHVSIVSFPRATWPPVVIDSMGATLIEFPEGSLRDIVQKLNVPVESMVVSLTGLPAASLRSVKASYDLWPAEKIQVSIQAFPLASLKTTKVPYNNWPVEKLTASIVSFPNASI